MGGGLRRCVYDGCFRDEDCETVCVCALSEAASHYCAGEGRCEEDADCGPGGACQHTLGDCGEWGGIVGAYCRTAEDACTHDQECGVEDRWGADCRYDPAEQRFACDDRQCAG